MIDKTKPEGLSEDDLDRVQGGASRVHQAGAKGVILSSESEEPTVKGGAKGIVLSSETHEPTVKGRRILAGS